MASISTDSSGNRRIQFVAADGIRRTIRVGSGSKRDAEFLMIKFESLHSAKLLGNAPDRDRSIWLASLGDDLHSKLATVGLVEPRHPVDWCLTLDEWSTKHVDQQTAELTLE